MDQDTEDPGVSKPTEEDNAMPENPQGPIPTNNNNIPKVETPSDGVTINDKSKNEE